MVHIFRTRTVVCLLLWTFVFCLPLYTASAKGPAPSVATLEKQFKKLVKIRDEISAGIKPADPSNRDNGVLRVAVPHVADANSVTLQLVRKDGAFTAMSWAEGWTRHSSRIEIIDGSWNGKDVKVAMRVHFSPREMTRGEYGSLLHRSNSGPYSFPITRADGRVLYKQGDPIPMEGSLTLTFRSSSPGRAKGKFKVTNPANGPFRPDEINVTAEWIPAGRPDFPPFKPASLGISLDAKGLAAFVPFGMEASMVDQGRLVYEQIRALDLQARTGIPFAIAFDNITHTPITYEKPTLTELKKSGKGTFEEGNKKAVPTLDAIEDDLDLDDVGSALDAGAKAEEAKKNEELQAKKTALLGKMQEHVDEMVRVASAWRQKQPKNAGYQVGDLACADPGFGPYSAPRPIKLNKDRVNRLPASVGSEDGPQDWPHVSGWSVMGPIPILGMESYSPYLPDTVPGMASFLVVQTNRVFGTGGRVPKLFGTGYNPWTTVPEDERNGFVSVPKYTAHRFGWGGLPGLNYGGYMAVSQIESPKDVTVWAALACPARGAIWVNDRLVMTSGFKDDQGSWYMPQKFKMPLRKGLNRILVRVDCYHQKLGLSLRVCVRGKPRTAEQVAADGAILADAYAKAGPAKDRMNGGECQVTREFKDQRPPLAWDIEKKINVLWRTYLPESRGGPLLIGDRVLVTQEPFSLACLDRATGKILWKRYNDAIEVLFPELWEEEKAQVEAFDELDMKRTLTSDEKKKRTELEKKRRTFLAQRVGKSSPIGYYLPLYSDKMQRTIGYGGGNTFAKPISDGNNIWCKQASGGGFLFTCYDLDGNRKWAKYYEKCQGGTGGAITPPLLLGDNIIFQAGRYGKGTDKEIAGDEDCEAGEIGFHANPRKYCLMAIDRNTGEKRWETPAYSGQRWGNKFDADCVVQPFPLRLTNGKETMDVVIHSAVGAVYRASDGKQLMRFCGGYSNVAPPVDDGQGRVYFSENQITGVKFTMIDRDNITARVLFRRDILCAGSKMTYSRDFMLWDGRLLRMKTHLRQYDRATGKMCARQPIENWPFWADGPMYMPSIITANDVLYIASAGDGGQLKAAMNPLQLVKGGHPLVLARNWIKGTSGAPVCYNDKMIARLRDEIVCFGHTGDEGEQYEAEAVARTLLSTQLPPPVPANDPTPIELPYEPRQYPAGGFGAARVYPDVPLGAFALASHPIPVENAAKIKALLAGKDREKTLLGLFGGNANAAANKKVGDVALSTRAIEFMPIIGIGEVRTAGAYSWKKVAVYDQQYGTYYYLHKFHEDKPNTICLYGFNLAIDRDVTMRLTLGRERGITAWIDGIEIKDGQRFHAQYGRHKLLIMTEVRGEDELQDTFRPVLWDARTPEYEKQYRKQRLDAMRPWLQRAAGHINNPELKAKVSAALM